MALIDVLPTFVPKPLDFSGFKTRLVPRPDAVQADSQSASSLTSNAPGTASTTDATTPAPTTSTTTTPAPKPMYVPDEYAAYEPVLQAFDEAGITNPDARAAIVAQFANEVGWDPKPVAYNYGNLTAGSTWKGPIVIRNDKDAQGRTIKQKFRSYGSTKEFAVDYVDFLKTLYPEAYKQLVSDKFNIDAYTAGLIDGKRRYAENPQYKSAVKSTFQQVLEKFRNNN